MNTGTTIREAAVANPKTSARFAPLRALRERASALTVTASILIGLAIWEIIARFIVHDKLFLVSPSGVVIRSIQLWQTGDLQHNIITSGIEFVLGVVVAIVVGVILGLILSTNASLRTALTPWVSAFNATPIVALSPLLILWFGLGLMSKIVVVFSTAVFAVLVNTETGIENVDNGLVETALAFGANRRQTFTKVLLPSAVPYIVAGIRLAIGRGLVGVVVAELFGAKAGLGFLITVSSETFDMGGLFVAVVILAIAGVLTSEGLKVVERQIAPWRWA